VHPIAPAAVLASLLVIISSSGCVGERGLGEDQRPGSPAAGVLRSREALFAPFDAEGRSPSSHGGAARELTLPLFDDARFVARQLRVERRGADDFTWFGEVAGASRGQVILVSRGGAINGHVAVGDRVFSISPVDGARHRIAEVDVRALPPEGHPAGAATRPAAPGAAGLLPVLATSSLPAGATGAPSTIHLLVVYSNQVQAAYPDILGRIQLAVDQTNQIFANTDIPHRLQLVHAAHVSFDEADWMETLAALTVPVDGVLDEVHDLRRAYKADVVSLWYGDLYTYCGLANMYKDNTTPFHIVHAGCATSSMTFAHELGHNFGGRHNTEADTSSLPFAYGHGASSPTGKWRTIMSYDNACPSGCPRIPYYSTPLKSYDGEPLGDATTRDVTRVITETGGAIGQYGEQVAAPPARTSVRMIAAADDHSLLELTEIYPGRWHGIYPFPPGTTSVAFVQDGQRQGATLMNNLASNMEQMFGWLASGAPAVDVWNGGGGPMKYLVEVNTSASSFTLSALNTAWPQVYLRGTSNGWGTTPFVYVDQQAWIVEATFAGKSDDRFKFDVHGNWSESYGDGDHDGIADQLAGNDIPITQGAGRYRIYVNAATRRYVVTKLSSAPTIIKRTVVLIYGKTQPGQDMFIRGGIDHNYAAAALGKSCTAANLECAIPIVHRNLANATTAPWKTGDSHLDWYGAQPGQVAAGQGSPLDWTTDLWPAAWGPLKTVAVDGYGVTPLNTYGQHYWLLDVDMDCSRTVGGWFELKSFISGGPGWEGDVAQTGTPYSSKNHFAQCGKLNVFQRGSRAAIFGEL